MKKLEQLSTEELAMASNRFVDKYSFLNGKISPLLDYKGSLDHILDTVSDIMQCELTVPQLRYVVLFLFRLRCFYRHNIGKYMGTRFVYAFIEEPKNVASILHEMYIVDRDHISPSEVMATLYETKEELAPLLDDLNHNFLTDQPVLSSNTLTHLESLGATGVAVSTGYICIADLDPKTCDGARIIENIKNIKHDSPIYDDIYKVDQDFTDFDTDFGVMDVNQFKLYNNAESL